MRGAPHSSFRTPLDDVLRSPANLRVLRALGRRSRTQPEIGRETGLTKPTVSRAIETLWDLGLLATRGVGEPTSVREDHPIASALLQLLDRERERVERVYADIRATFADSAISVWIEGKVARGEDGPADPLEVGILAEAAGLDRIRDGAEQQIAKIERTFAVLIELKYYTRADLASMSDSRRSKLAAVLPLTGVTPMAFISSSGTPQARRTHSHRDREALTRTRALEKLIARDSTLVPRALTVSRHIG